MAKEINKQLKEKKYCKCGCGEVTNICNHTINKLGKKKGEYNIYLPFHHMKVKNPMEGNTHTKEAREKIRQSKLGWKMPQWHKEIMRKKAIENPPMKNPETAKKVSEKLKGRIFSEEHKRNISKSHMGIPSWLKGKKRPYSNCGVKIGHKFGPHSEEHKEKIRQSNIGKNLGKRASEETKRKLSLRFSGDKNPAWLGGKSFEPYTPEFNSKFKRAIRLRDGFMCSKCNMKEEDHEILLKQVLHIHHINYDKSISIPENCITVCLRCNIEANINREEWTKFYQSILSKRFGYEYSEEGLAIIQLNKVEEKWD